MFYTPKVTHPEFGECQIDLDHSPDFMRADALEYRHDAADKFREQIKKIRECDQKIRFRFLEKITVNNVTYRNVIVTCQIFHNSDRDPWLIVTGDRDVDITHDKWGSKLSDSARNKLRADLHEWCVNVTMRDFDYLKKYNLEYFIKNTREKLAHISQNVQRIREAAFFVENEEVAEMGFGGVAS